MIYVFLDVETTGLDPRHHGIIEIGASIYHETGRKYGTFRDTCNPGDVGVSERALEINGFTLERIEKSLPICTVLKAFFMFIEEYNDDMIFVMHNAPFDTAFILEALRQNYMETKHFRRVLDTVSIAHSLVDERKLMSLSDLSERLGVQTDDWDRHSALGDAEQTARCFWAMQQLRPKNK